MQIRELHQDELWLCSQFGQEFHDEKVLGAFSFDVFFKNWTAIYTQGIGIIFGLFDDQDQLIGGIGGVVTDDLTSGLSTMHELFWFVEKAKRHTTGRWPLRLVYRLREWGKLHGATRLRMVHLLEPGEDPATVRLADIYTHILKLRPLEVVFDGPIGD
jgi:hypothetical protein